MKGRISNEVLPKNPGQQTDLRKQAIQLLVKHPRREDEESARLRIVKIDGGNGHGSVLKV